MVLRVLCFSMFIYSVCSMIPFKASLAVSLLIISLLVVSAGYRMTFNRPMINEDGMLIPHSVDYLSYVILLEFSLTAFILVRFGKRVSKPSHLKLVKINLIFMALVIPISILHLFDIRPFQIPLISFLYIGWSALFIYYVKSGFIKERQLILTDIQFSVGPLPEHYGITKREAEIIDLVIQGNSNNEIAEKLFITIGTVKTHLYRIFKKTGVKNRYELIHLSRKSVK